jgi:hypothetical protein
METNKIDLIKVKQNHSLLFNSLREIINSHNPMNFGHISEVPDEYYSEVAEILTRIKPNMNLQEIHELVFEIFKKWFHPIRLCVKDFSALASNIELWLHQNKSGFITTLHG